LHPERVPPTLEPKTLVNVLVLLTLSTIDRANVIWTEVESELIQFLSKPGVEHGERYI
jgi:hypothetical protein